LIRRIAHEEPPTPRRVDPRIPRDLETIVLKAAAKDPGGRYQTADALAEDLRRFLADRPILARRTPLAERAVRWCRRNPALALTGSLAVAALLAVVALAVGFALHQSRAAAALAREQEQTRDALEESRLLSAGLTLDRGLRLCEEGRTGCGMLWLARSLEVAPEGADDLRRVIRTNLAGWGRSLHRLRLVLPHPDKVLCLAVSPDEKVLLTGCADGTARLWDLATGDLLGPSFRHGGAVHAVAWAPDGATLATAGADRTARLWDRATGRAARAALGHPGVVRALAFSPDGRFLATGCADGKVRLWELAGGTKPRPALRPHLPRCRPRLQPGRQGDLDRQRRGEEGGRGAAVGPGRGAGPVAVAAARPGRRGGLRPRRPDLRDGRPRLGRGGLG